MNLTHFLFEENTEMPEGLASVISDIANVSKSISHDVARSGLLGLHGAVGTENIQGEEVQILDERSNDALKSALAENDYVLVIASEEEADIVDCSADKAQGYGVAYDPLDGSSNIDVNGSVGTIFSILPALNADESVFLQTSNSQVGAGYVLYGSSTVMVFSTGSGVHEFTLDPDTGEYIMTMQDVKIPRNTGYIAYNSYVLPKMDEKKAEAYEKLLLETKRSQRWNAAMVSDIHRTIMKGGFFAYPETGTDGSRKGKLRLQYEVKPLGWLVERAGGKCIAHDKPLAEVVPQSLHERASTEIGDAGTIDQYLSYLK